MVKVTKKQIEEELKNGAKNITEDDLKKVIGRIDEIEKKFEYRSPLRRFASDIKLLCSIIKDYASGEYRKIPWWSIAAIVFTLMYMLNPIDLIPDFISFAGYIDDAAVLAACLFMVEQDLNTYKDMEKELMN